MLEADGRAAFTIRLRYNGGSNQTDMLRRDTTEDLSTLAPHDVCGIWARRVPKRNPLSMS